MINNPYSFGVGIYMKKIILILSVCASSAFAASPSFGPGGQWTSGTFSAATLTGTTSAATLSVSGTTSAVTLNVSDTLLLRTTGTEPASAAESGTVGTFRIAGNYIYICTGTNTWVRAQLLTW